MHKQVPICSLSPGEVLPFCRFLLKKSVLYFYDIIRNTVVISVPKLIFNFPAPIILALMLNAVRKQQFKRTIQTVSYLPYFVSWVVVTALFHKLF